jgi:hypothetical protein
LFVAYLKDGVAPVTISRLRGSQKMGNVSSIITQLKVERDRVERQLSGLNAALVAFAGVYRGTAKPGRKRRKMSAAGRAKIAAAQKKRWARARARAAKK